MFLQYALEATWFGPGRRSHQNGVMSAVAVVAGDGFLESFKLIQRVPPHFRKGVATLDQLLDNVEPPSWLAA